LDKHALEQALETKERTDGSVTVIGMAPPSAVNVLREAISMGADDAVLLSDKSFAGADTLATSYVLAKGIKKLGAFDLIFCGNESLDGGTGQVGPEIAEFLGIPHVSHVRKISIPNNEVVYVERSMENAYMMVEARIPALLCVLKQINLPRHISLARIFVATQTEIKILGANDLDVDFGMIGLAGSPTQVADLFMPETKRRGEIIGGDPESASEQLIYKLRELGMPRFRSG
jgi:electron transfer flavoprotein beta subunit